MRDTDIIGTLPPEYRLPENSRQRLKEELMTGIIGQAKTRSESPSPRRRRRLVTLLTAAVLALASIGTAWAVFGRPEQTTRILCPDNSIITAVSGDPVADCAAELQRQGVTPPAMQAYLNENGGVVVEEEGAEIPPNWQPLGDDFRQDSTIIQLEAALADVSHGLMADCYTSDQAIPIIQREVTRLGLNWRIEIGDNADGTDTCAYGSIVPERALVTIVGIDGLVGNNDEPWALLGQQLSETLEAQCLTVDEAAQAVDEIAAQVGLDPDAQIRMTTTIENSMECARADVTVGGIVFVDLRGPSD